MPVQLQSSSLLDLQNPSIDPDIQIAALKQIKHDIIGNEQRKEILIGQGIVESLARILQHGDKRRGRGKRWQGQTWSGRHNGDNTPAAGGAERGGEFEGSEIHDDSEEWTKEEEVRLQATLVVGSLAMGGPAFLYPLFAGSVHDCLLSALSPSDYSPRPILATLNTLNTISDAASLERPSGSTHPILTNAIPTLLYSQPHIESLVQILAPRSSSPHQQEQVRLATTLIAKTCREETHQTALLKAGVLNLLSSWLAALIVSLGYMLPSADPSVRSHLPPAPPKEYLSCLIDAIGAIIRNSSYRTARFLYSPAILGVFPIIVQDARDSSPFSQVLLNQQFLNPVEHLLPRIRTPRTKVETTWSKAFPALGAMNDLSDFPKMPSSTTETASSALADASGTADDNESPMCLWLLHMMRTERGANRLAAARLLSLVYHASLLSKMRDRQLGFLMVPLLVQMIDEAVPDARIAGRNLPVATPVSEDVLRTREEAPAILAALIRNSLSLQQYAVDASVIKKLGQMLKKSFDPVPNLPRPMWSPNPVGDGSNSEETQEARKIGPPGLHPKILHALKCRRGALEALAAVATKEDTYRRAIIDNGVMNCVVDSLTPYNSESISAGRVPTKDTLVNARTGNPIWVIIAACRCALAISRAVSVLRTNLVDAGMAKPIFSLLGHPNVEVRIAATDVLCNLLLDVSAMRKDLIDAGVVEALCDQAHSANPRLRLLSLWALKHLVLEETNETKMKCLEELGTGWLVQIISGEPGSGLNHSPAPISMGTPNAAGERVDILNATDEPMTSADEAVQEDDGDMAAAFNANPSLPRYYDVPAQLRACLYKLKQMENIPASTLAMMDEANIQEQGLDFIRNLIVRCGSAEMTDHLFSLIGSNRLLEILASKLKAKSGPWAAHPTFTSTLTPAAFTSFNLQAGLPPQHPEYFEGTIPWTYITNTSRAPPPYRPQDFHPAYIIETTLYILVHIAAGPPRHKRILLSFSTPTFPRGVIPEMIPHFDNPERMIRAACVWVIGNLTWVEDQSDLGAARQRAEELRALGFVPPGYGTGVRPLGFVAQGFGGAGPGGGGASGAVGRYAAGGVQAQAQAGRAGFVDASSSANSASVGSGAAATADGGILARMLNDPDLDVRERTKTAVEQLAKLLEGAAGGGASGGAGAGGGGNGSIRQPEFPGLNPGGGRQ